jgi:hypothetical protein
MHYGTAWGGDDRPSDEAGAGRPRPAVAGSREAVRIAYLEHANLDLQEIIETLERRKAERLREIAALKAKTFITWFKYPLSSPPVQSRRGTAGRLARDP